MRVKNFFRALHETSVARIVNAGHVRRRIESPHQAGEIKALKIIEYRFTRQRAEERGEHRLVLHILVVDFVIVGREFLQQRFVVAHERRGIDAPVIPHQHHVTVIVEDALKLGARFDLIEPMKRLPREDEVDRLGRQATHLGCAIDAGETRIVGKVIFNRLAHFLVRFNADSLVAVFQKKPGKNAGAGAGANVSDHAFWRHGAFCREQIENFKRIVRSIFDVIVDARLERFGFYPAGGGRFTAKITPTGQGASLRRIDIESRGAFVVGYAESFIAGVPVHVAERELATIGQLMSWPSEKLLIRGIDNAYGPGNIVLLTIEHEHVTEVFAGFGEKGTASEAVAKRVVGLARHYLASDTAIGEHLADQLMIPFALAGGGSFTVSSASEHARTNAEVIRKFLPVEISVVPLNSHKPDGPVKISIRK